MSDFVESLGLGFFAHRLKRLSEALVEGCGPWRRDLGLASPAKASSTLLLLAEEGPLTVTEIATRLQLSHPLIITMVRELEALELVETQRDPQDRRRRPVALTPNGRDHAAVVAETSDVVARTYAQLFRDSGVDGLAVVEALEHAIAQKSVAQRVAEAAAARQTA